MTIGNNPTDTSKLDSKRHILTDKKGIPLSIVISSASNHDIKLVADVMSNVVITRSSSSINKLGGRRLKHLCLDKAYNSKQVKQEIIKRDYVCIFATREKEERRKMRKKNKSHVKTHTARR